jgi:vesicle transport through interaction with t-SNAREs protein 1
MQIEIQGIPKSLKPKYQARLKSSEASLNRFKKLSKEMHSKLSRSDLLSSSHSHQFATSDDPYADDRTRLLAGTEILGDGSRRLRDSQRIALETEAQGADTLRILREQRDQIENSRNTVRWACFLRNISFITMTCRSFIRLKRRLTEQLVL